MLLAIISWVCASRWLARAAASSALKPSSLIQCSRRTSGGKAPWASRSCCRNREIKSAVSGSCRSTKSLRARLRAALSGRCCCWMRSAHASASVISSSRLTVRRAIRRTFSISPSRNMAGIAHSSPIDSGRTCWYASTKRSTLLEIDAPLGVRDEGDGNLVDARISLQRPAGQLGQLPVVAAREALANLQDVLLHQVEVVEQPLSRWPHVDVGVGAQARRASSRMAACSGPAGRAAASGAAPLPAPQPAARGPGSGPARRGARTQQLTVQRSGDKVLAPVGSAPKGEFHRGERHSVILPQHGETPCAQRFTVRGCMDWQRSAGSGVSRDLTRRLVTPESACLSWTESR